MNGDGYKDLILGDSEGKLYFYPGIDGSHFGSSESLFYSDDTPITFGYETIKPVIVDYNNDGLLDMIMANSTSGTVYDQHPITLYLNEGSSTNPRFSKNPISLGMTGIKPCAAVGDIDGDGLFDLVVSEYNFYQYNGDYNTLNWYKNMGTIDAPQWGTKEVLKFRGNPIYSYYHYAYSQTISNWDELLSTGSNWAMLGKDIVNISINDYNGDGKSDLIIGYGGFGSTGELIDDSTGVKINYYESIVNVYYTPNDSGQTSMASLQSIDQKSSSIKMIGNKLYLKSEETGDYSIEIFSLRGEKLFEKKVFNAKEQVNSIVILNKRLVVGKYIALLKCNGISETIPLLISK